MKKREIAFKNKQEVANQLNKFEIAKPLVDRVLDEWEKLKLDPLTIEELTELLRGADIQKTVKKSIIEHLRPEDLLLAGRTVSRERMGELLTPPDVADLQAAVTEASVHFPPLAICEIKNSKLELSKDAVSELENRNTLYTDDIETLETVQSIISGIKKLIDGGKVGEGIITPLIRAGVIDHYTGDGLQPARNLFKTQ